MLLSAKQPPRAVMNALQIPEIFCVDLRKLSLDIFFRTSCRFWHRWSLLFQWINQSSISFLSVSYGTVKVTSRNPSRIILEDRVDGYCSSGVPYFFLRLEILSQSPYRWLGSLSCYVINSPLPPFKCFRKRYTTIFNDAMATPFSLPFPQYSQILRYYFRQRVPRLLLKPLRASSLGGVHCNFKHSPSTRQTTCRCLFPKGWTSHSSVNKIGPDALPP